MDETTIPTAFQAPSGTANETAIFASTFHARQGCEELMLTELQRLVHSTRLDNSCLFCDLFHFTEDRSIFVVHSVWLSHQGWFSREGWVGHPAGLGLLDQWLLRPIEVIEMEEIV